jgi:sulfoxide reductase heme-binding subunit YedZ
MRQPLWRQRFMKVGVFSACLTPLAMLAWDTITDQLGANPIEAITRQTGTWTLRFLLISLAVTPARRLAGWNSVIRFRRMLGLFAFFYASLHFLTYIWLDQFFVVEDIAKDVIERPFITVGFLGFAMLIPLAVTSTAKMIKRLGGKRWQLLHRLVYASAVAGVVHYLWLVKADVQLPLIYGSLLAVLLGYRLWAICAPYIKPRKVFSRQPIMRA